MLYWILFYRILGGQGRRTEQTSTNPTASPTPRKEEGTTGAYRGGTGLAGLMGMGVLILLSALAGCQELLEHLPTELEIRVASVLVSPTEVVMRPGDAVQLSVTVKDSQGEPLADQEVTWSSSAPQVAVVDGSGMVTAADKGSATITAWAETKTAQSLVIVGDEALLVSTSPDRSNPKLLTGQVLSGGVYVFTAQEDGVDSVQFLLDGQHERWQVLPPFDFGGGPADSPNVWDTWSVADGQHQITAKIFEPDGPTTVSSVFTVDNTGDSGSPPPPPPPPSGVLPAFPGAEGFGAMAFSNVDRSELEVLFVTNLNDDGSGSLRDAIEKSDRNRLSIIVFRTGGTITLRSVLALDRANLYIAGQTAPGGGIQLRRPEGSGSTVIKVPRDGSGHDIVVRYLRLRSGKGEPGVGDNISINGGYNLVFDHCSIQWGNDENIGVGPIASNGTPLHNLTIQRCIIAEALRTHSTGILIFKSDGDPYIGDISLHHNLFAHNAHRNPRVGTTPAVQVVNNVLYNWRNRVGRTVNKAEVDFIGNYFLSGPWGPEDRYLEHEYQDGTVLPSVYLSGNIADPMQMDPTADQANLIKYSPDGGGGRLPPSAFRSGPIASPQVPITTQSAANAFESVLGDSGANARLDCTGNWTWNQDRIDGDIVAHVRTKTGPSTDEENDHQSDYGGYPTLATGTPCADQDEDGMPDAYESAYGLNPNDKRDAVGDVDGDGYTNLEEYLSGGTP